MLQVVKVVLVLLVFTFTVQAQDYTPIFESTECSFAVPDGAAVECGFLTVPQDRSGDVNDTIQLAVAVYRSENATAEPLLFLQGGPGGGIVEALAAAYGTFIAPITETRDFIVYDQRGTGLSQPPLNCPELNELTVEALRQNYDTETSTELSEVALAACRERLETESGVNTAAYTSAASAADIRDLAQVLGYEQVNLYGGSYGTRLALTVMRDYPELVRSAVLDGAIPVELNLYEQQGAKTQAALDALFEACAADEACNTAYPNLEQVYLDTVAALDETPGTVTITNPADGEQIETEVDGLDFTSGLFFTLQIGQFARTAPQIIYAVSEDSYDALITPLTIPLLIGENINIGMFFSVNCHEEMFSTTPEALNAAAAEYPDTEAFMLSALFGSGEATQRICENWGAAPLSEIETEPVVSDIPTLILNGQFDPATPPYFGEQVAENLPNSFNYVFPGQGHAEGPAGGCPLEITLQFLENPTTEPDASCIDAMEVSFVVATALNLVEYTSDQFGFTGLIPDGWTDAGSGIFLNPNDQQFAVIQQAAPATADELLSLLASQLQLESIDATGDTIEANGLTWALYNTTLQGIIAVDIALAESDGTTYLILLQSPVGQREATYENLFLPLVNGLQP